MHEFIAPVFFNFFSQSIVVHLFFNIYYSKRQYFFLFYYFFHDLSSNSIVYKTQVYQSSKHLFNAINFVSIISFSLFDFFVQLIKTSFASRFPRTFAITKKIQILLRNFACDSCKRFQLFKLSKRNSSLIYKYSRLDNKLKSLSALNRETIIKKI